MHALSVESLRVATKRAGLALTSPRAGQIQKGVTTMIPGAFEYHAPRTIGEATALLTRLGDEAKVLSGGQSLIPMMKLRLATPTHLIDINEIRPLPPRRVDRVGILIDRCARHSSRKNGMSAMKEIDGSGVCDLLAIGRLCEHMTILAAKETRLCESFVFLLQQKLDMSMRCDKNCR